MSETLTIVEKCLQGKSKATWFTHDECAELWAKGYTNVKSGNDRGGPSVIGYHDRLTHYDTLSYIRTRNGDIIANTQDWATGFARMPTIPFKDRDLVKDSLPLTALQNALIDIYGIEIVDRGEFWSCLFKIGDEYFLFARDDTSFQMFVTQLVEPVKTVKEAFESMKPLTVKIIEDKMSEEKKKEWPIERQGDLFFIGNPSAKDCEPPSTHLSYQKARLIKSEGFRGSKKIWWYPQIRRDNQFSRHTATRIIETNNLANIPDLGNTVQQVSGVIKHPQHRQLRLGKGWWFVIPNRVKRSISVENRGGGRGD